MATKKKQPALHFPRCLKKYENILKPYEQYIVEYAAIRIKPVGNHSDILGSKLLGIPYLPVGKDYPRDKDGQLMRMLIQINFAEVPNIENIPEQGILQLFVSNNKGYDDWESGEYCKIIYYEQIGEYQSDFSFLPYDNYKNLPFEKRLPILSEHRLSFIKKKRFDKYCCFDYKLAGKQYSLDFFDKHKYKLTFEQPLSLKQIDRLEQFFILDGFYADIIDNEILGKKEIFNYHYIRLKKDENDYLLLHLSSDEELCPVWLVPSDDGGGWLYLFISPDDLEHKRFENAYFRLETWPC
jgi:uncharacterized protein YwqG